MNKQGLTTGGSGLPKIKNLLWSDGRPPLMGLRQGPDPVLIWGRDHACVFPKSATGPCWLPERLGKHHHAAVNSRDKDEDHLRSLRPLTLNITTNTESPSSDMGITQESLSGGREDVQLTESDSDT